MIYNKCYFTRCIMPPKVKITKEDIVNVAVELAKDLGGTAILFSELEEYLKSADLVISATSAPHTIIDKQRLESIGLDNGELMMVDIANPRDISEDVSELGIRLFNIDDLREIADYNTKLREKEFSEAEIIIDEDIAC